MLATLHLSGTSGAQCSLHVAGCGSQRACRAQVARGAVFSLHKRSTRAHILRHATAVLGAADAAVMAELHYDLPATYKHHRCAPISMRMQLCCRILELPRGPASSCYISSCTAARIRQWRRAWRKVCASVGGLSLQEEIEGHRGRLVEVHNDA